jgi:hypothetical protein
MDKDKKTHTSISIDVEKAFDKIQYPFMIKSLKKLRINAIYDKPIANIILNVKKPDIISFEFKNETKLSTLLTLTQYGAWIPSYSKKASERNKRYRNRKGRRFLL